ncbi:MAG TPA: ABC transporter permease, partial [Vicinamibacterales bacterium]
MTRLYFEEHANGGHEVTLDLTSYAVFKGIRDAAPAAQVAAYYRTLISEGAGAQAVKLQAGLATADFFRVLGVSVPVGRGFLAQDAQVGAPLVAIVSHDLWQQRFGGQKNVLGQTLTITGKRYAIVGVTPPGFTGIDLDPVDVWLPLEATANDLIMPNYLQIRGAWAISVIGRLGPKASPEIFQAQATSVFRAVMIALRGADPSARVLSAPLLRDRGPMMSDQARVAMWLSGVAGIVLVIAALNCVSLLLVRTMQRATDLAVRVALGASPARLLRTLMIEHVILAIASAAVAVVVAMVSTGAITMLLLPPGAPRTVVSLSRLFGFTTVIGLFVGLVVSVPVLLQFRRTDTASQMRSGPRSGTHSRSPGRTVSLVTQIALTMVLLVAAGSFATSLRRASALDLGFNPEDAWVVNVDFAGMAVRQAAIPAIEVYRRLEEAVRAVPGVTAAAVTTSVPFQFAAPSRVSIPGRDSTTLPKAPVMLSIASVGYAQALGLRLRAGRWFTPSDYGSGSNTAVVGETMAKTYWPGESPLGKCLLSGEPQCRIVIGVVDDTHRAKIRETQVSQLYITDTRAQMLSAHARRSLVVRSSRGPAIVNAIRAAAQAKDKSLAYVSVRPVTDLIAPTLFPWRMGAALLTVFGVVALGLAALGLFGVMNWSVAQRTHELGVRLALGASRVHVLRLVLTQALFAIIGGIVIGLGVVIVEVHRLEP